MTPGQQFYLPLTKKAHIYKFPYVVLQEKSAGLEAPMYTPEADLTLSLLSINKHRSIHCLTVLSSS